MTNFYNNIGNSIEKKSRSFVTCSKTVLLQSLKTLVFGDFFESERVVCRIMSNESNCVRIYSMILFEKKKYICQKGQYKIIDNNCYIIYNYYIK